jgi:hypothetical protein
MQRAQKSLSDSPLVEKYPKQFIIQQQTLCNSVSGSDQFRTNKKQDPSNSISSLPTPTQPWRPDPPTPYNCSTCSCCGRALGDIGAAEARRRREALLGGERPGVRTLATGKSTSTTLPFDWTSPPRRPTISLHLQWRGERPGAGAHWRSSFVPAQDTFIITPG